MFETQSKDEIQQRMAADLSGMNPNSTVEGSFGRDVINATSVEFEKTYAISIHAPHAGSDGVLAVAGT